MWAHTTHADSLPNRRGPEKGAAGRARPNHRPRTREPAQAGSSVRAFPNTSAYTGSVRSAAGFLIFRKFIVRLLIARLPPLSSSSSLFPIFLLSAKQKVGRQLRCQNYFIYVGKREAE